VSFPGADPVKPENRIERFATHWQQTFTREPYYRARYSWQDFGPVYRYAFRCHEENPTASFEELEPRLEAGWDVARGSSRLAWQDARKAVRAAWGSVDRILSS
jgi:hypothetical protein